MSEELPAADTRPLLVRLWVYQRERFPVFGHGLLVLAFSSSAVCFSALLAGSRGWPPLPAFGVAFLTCLIFFMQLRVADEFKDAAEDAEFRPYRPVPRGLVSLFELGVLFVCGAAVQLGLALWLHPPLVVVLLVGWAYLALMSREFFVREWITARPVTYLWTHMLIMPLVDLYATACHWLPELGRPAAGLPWFLLVSFCNGLVIEVGRKIRSAEQEEEGVPTYTRLWGRVAAPWVWFAFVFATGASAAYALCLIGFGLGVWALAVLLLLGLGLTVAFVMRPTAVLAPWFERFAGAWTLAVYLLLGLVPMLLA